MLKSNTSTTEAQAVRLGTKNRLQLLRIAAQNGAGLSTQEASVIAKIVDETFILSVDGMTYRSGQLKYSCVKARTQPGSPAGAMRNGRGQACPPRPR